MNMRLCTPLGRAVSASRHFLASRVSIPAIALAIGVLAWPVSLTAQGVATGTIEGRIKNGGTEMYLNQARVRVVGTTREAMTNEFGEYRLSNVPAGSAVLDVFYTGLANQQVSVQVTAGSTTKQDFTLKSDDGEAVLQLGEFVVQSQREMAAAQIAINEQRFAATRKDVVSTDAFGEINQGNVGEFVKFLPGISLDVKDGNTPSGIMVRGFDPNYTNVTMDGGQLASTLIANTQTSSRQFVLEGMNINNIARIEVTKLPTPDMSANMLGGAVNFISKSAFERARPELRLSAYLSGNEKALEADKTPGPFNKDTYKVLPSFDLQYVNPVNKRFGYVVTAQSSYQYYIQNKAVIGYKFTNSGAMLANGPYITNVNTSFAPNRTDRVGGGLTFDFKPWEGSVIKLNLQSSQQKQQTSGRGINYSVGTSTITNSYDPHNTYGVAGSGASVGLTTSFQERHALTRTVGLSWEHTMHDWEFELGGNYSNSNNRTRDMTKGFFRTISVSLPGVSRMNLLNVDTSSGKMGSAEVYDASGNRINELDLANWKLTGGVNASEPANNSDDVKEVRGSVTRSLTIANLPVKLKAGGNILDSTRDAEYNAWSLTYFGPDGKANTGDEYLSTITNYASKTDAGISPGFGRVAPQWPDSYSIFQNYIEHPTWWGQTSSQQGDMVKNNAVRSPWLHEKITSGYLMGDTKTFHGKLRLVGGVRYEYTEDEGQGYRQDTTAVTGRTDSGSYDYNSLLYKRRNYYAKRHYAYYHPSVSGTFNITENLLLRAGFAKTIGRPNLSDIVPNLYVSPNANYGVPGSSSSDVPGYVTGANTNLKPWTAKNYDYTVEYYLPKGGMVMLNAYRKDISDFQGSITRIVDQALATQLGLDSSTLGYQYTQKVNIGDARIQGWEASLTLPFSNFAAWGPMLAPFGESWARHFSLIANATHLDLSGSRITSSDWKRYIPRTRNFGIQWQNLGKFSGSLLLNWKGRMLRDTNSSFVGANEYIRARYQLDASSEYQITKRYSAFFAVRNLLNSKTEWEVSGPGAPKWATMTNLEDYGAQYSLGVRAVF